ncbi:transglutaminaseTgpA domain-containing protein [Pseudoalteromonas fenneropenaei]|uniref:TransglutaminaseTgpA domain-containing protein n=1 Tax=Pseudoalteromonas fenneropenaei TaxID=1737459 RepID=A0ABV7CFI3_9GAMM
MYFKQSAPAQVTFALMYVAQLGLLYNELNPVTLALNAVIICAGMLFKAKAANEFSNFSLNTMALAGSATILFSFGLSQNLNLFVALLILACVLKLMQARSRVMLQQLAVLNCFSLCLVFLFKQDLLTTLAVLLLCFLNFAVLAWLQKPTAAISKVSMQVIPKLLFALPLAALMLLLLPRLPSFWQLPNAKLAQTGLAENVDPFQISQLANSDKLAFRVEWQDKPKLEPLYWRAIVHDRFDGNAWLKSRWMDTPQFYPSSNGAKYTVIAEPSNLPWLFAADWAKSPSRSISSNSFGTLFNDSFTPATQTYQVEEVAQLPRSYLNWQLAGLLALPAEGNPQSRALAKTLLRLTESEQPDIAATLTNLRRYFQDQGFSYTLSPPTMAAEDNIDQFLLNHKRGFCGHYASASAFLLRVMGIPSRVVSGYLGGEFIAAKNYTAVYQYDAHAWVEYFDGQYWQAFDPTAWIAPERLSGSLSQTRSLREEFVANLGLSLAGLSDYQALAWLRAKLEEIDYRWTRWVINFDGEQQHGLLENLFGNNWQTKAGLVGIALMLVLSALFLWYLQKRQDLTLPLPVRLCQQLLAFNSSSVATTPIQGLTDLSVQYPELKPQIEQFKLAYTLYRYNNQAFSETQTRNLKQLIKLIKTKEKSKK